MSKIVLHIPDIRDVENPNVSVADTRPIMVLDDVENIRRYKGGAVTFEFRGKTIYTNVPFLCEYE